MTDRTTSTDRNPTRRHFLRQAGFVAAAATIVPRHVLGGAGFVAPSERVNVAIIGAGGQGMTNMRRLFQLSDVRVVALADVMEQADYSRFYYGGTAGRLPAQALADKYYQAQDAKYPGCKTYVDFREMLDKESSIDAVVVATPDHVHAIATLEAIKRGKHVYCEKPLARTVYEARTVAEAARAAGVATQMGNQGHSGDGIRMTVEWIRDGAIGPVREVHSWSAGVFDAAKHGGRPSERPPVPRELNWDLWLGPVAHRPYHPAYAPYTWRQWWAFGTGVLGDMACHNLDPAIWALDLGHPTTVEARRAGGNQEATPYAAQVHYQFPARGNQPPVKVTWYSGMMPPRPEELDPGTDLIGNGNGILFVGDRGKIMCAGWAGSPRLVPIRKTKEYQKPAPTIARSKGHHRDWIDAAKGGKPASANFDYSANLTEIVMLGNVAIRTGKKLTWDGKAMKATNCPEADPYIRPEYVNGWSL